MMKKAMLIGAPIAVAGAVAAVLAVERVAAPPDRGALTRHDGLRRFNRAVTNPIISQFARFGLDYPAIVVVPGRRSGKLHETPVFAMPAGDRFIIPLPYGEGSDWCRNVLEHGGCTLRFRKEPLVLTDPHIVEESAVAMWIDPRRLAFWRRFGIDRYLTLRSVG